MIQELVELSAKSLIEAMLDPVMVLDSRGRIVAQNAACKKLLGYALRDILDKHLLDCGLASTYSLKELRSAKRRFSAAIKEDKGFVFEYEFLTKKSKSVHVLLSGSMLKDAKKRTTHIIALFRDITERKQTERRTEHVNKVLRTIRNINHLIVRETDRKRLIQGVCDILIEGRGFFNAWIALLDESNELLASAESGLGKEFLPIIEQLRRGELTACGTRSLTQSEVFVTEDPFSTCTDCPLAKTYASRGGLTVRLEHQGRLYGLMSSSVPTEFILDREEHGLFKEVAADIAFALYNLEVETKQKKAEIALEDQRQWLDGTLSSIGDAVIATDTEARVTFMNHVAENLTGWTAEEATGRDIHKIFHIINEQTREEAENPVDRVLKGGIIVGLANHTVLISRDGREIPIDDCGAPIRVIDDRILGVVLVFHDITQRRNAEKILRESEARLRSVFESRMVGTLYWNADGDITDANDAFLEMVGYSKDEILSGAIRWRDMTPPEYTEQDNRALEEIATKGVMTPIEKEYIRKDGRRIPILLGGASLPGPTLNGVAFVLDITDRKEAERALREERNKAQMYLDIAGVMIVSLDSNGTVTLVNRRSCETLGYDSKDIIGKDWFNTFIPQSLRKEVYRAFTSLMKGDIEPVEYFENPILTKDGEERIIAWHNIVVTDESGVITGTLSSGEDITERKEAEEQLRVSEEKHKRLFDTSQDGIAYTDLNGLFIDVNQGFLNIVGYDHEELLSKTFHDITPEKWASAEAEINKTQVRVRGYSEEYEKEYICKDGTVVPVSIRTWSVKDDKDRPLHTIALVRDITERKRAEEELRKHRDHLEGLVRERTVEVDNLQRYTRELVEVNLDPLTTFNQDGVILDVNEAIVRATGRARDKLIGTPFADYFTNSERAHNCVITVFETGEVRDYELVMKRQDGAEIVVVCNASVYKNQAGQVAGAFLAARDITERKNLEEQLIQEKRLAVLGQLGAGIGHELRNPLGAIKNAIFFLRMVIEEPEPEIRETLEILEKEMATSERIINSLLDYARPKPPTRSKVDLNEVVQEVLSDGTMPENIAVVTQLDKALPTIQADPHQLGQVFVNLTLNAIQAMPTGGQLTIKSKREGPDWVSVSIADTGVGISVEDMERLFEPLFTTKAKGIGLGLAISKTIVDGHEGTIEVESELGKGSVFFVRLPMRTKEME